MLALLRIDACDFVCSALFTIFRALLQPGACGSRVYFQGLINPKKDYSTGELLVGAASVAQGTLLMIDETGLEPGQLLEQGVKNVQAVHALIGAKELVAGGGDGGWRWVAWFDVGVVANKLRVRWLWF